MRERERDRKTGIGLLTRRETNRRVSDFDNALKTTFTISKENNILCALIAHITSRII